MATVRSLLCWGGIGGSEGSSDYAVTLTIASPCVMAFSAYALYFTDGQPVVFTTTGSLPTGLTAGVTYYLRPDPMGYLQSHIYDTYAHAMDTGSTTGRVDTSGSQSGTHYFQSDYWYNLNTAGKARYSTRVYGSLLAAVAARGTDTDFTVDEIFEIGEEFFSSDGTILNMTVIPSGSIDIRTHIDGIRTTGFHYGNVKRGYYNSNTGSDPIVIDRARVTVDGLNLRMAPKISGSAISSTLAAALCVIKNNILQSDGNGYGLRSGLLASQVKNNIIYNCQNAVVTLEGGDVATIYQHNTIVKCAAIQYLYGNINYPGSWINNVGVGVWATPPGFAGVYGSRKNAGVSGDGMWGSDPVTIVSADAFVDYANNDFRITSTSALRDDGAEFSNMEPVDILGLVRPNFSAEEETADLPDIGAFEYDSGHGEPPVSCTFSITGISAGAEVRLYEDDPGPGIIGTEIEGVESWTGGTYEYEYEYSGTPLNIAVQVISDDYEESVTYYTLGGANQTIPLVLKQEENV